MHATERENVILEFVGKTGFITFSELERRIDASPATLRRDLQRLADEGRLERVRGGAKLPNSGAGRRAGRPEQLAGVPFHENVHLMPKEKEAIGRAAAMLCEESTSVMIDGGSTTLQMCRHLEGKHLQVFTNSLHIVRALIPQPDTRILVPGGTVFREQDIILSVRGDDSMPRFHAPQLFMGAAAIGAQGLMQTDIILVATERRLIEMAEELIVLVDHSKFEGSSGNVVCGLDEVDKVITDSGIDPKHVAMLESAGVEVLIAEMN
jgi:DeoR family ulaG and ulaABCDEF operon transcriptional repressor